MTRYEIKELYFQWMCGLVCKSTQSRSYVKLMHELDCVEFTYRVPMDGNRAEDGINLRYRFGYERGYPDSAIASYLDDRPCSVLEMMIALSMRCEEHIMSNPEIGDRTGTWFWIMIFNLGLGFMDDLNFDKRTVDRVLQRLLDRKYLKNGEGSLFGRRSGRTDMRTVDIWYQMCWFLDDFIEEEEECHG